MNTIKTLGERIRSLRKERKMTLEVLAGGKLSKGMLSLIENNKAKPSMDSLLYLANRLDVDMSMLLEEVSSQELRDVLEKAEELYNTTISEEVDKNEQLIALLQPYVENLSDSYEAARVLDMYGQGLYLGGSPNWKEYIDKAATMYDRLNIVRRRANLAIFKSWTKFRDHLYSEALEDFLQERQYINDKYAYIDPISRIDLDYHEAVFHYAVGNYETGIAVMEEAIEFSKTHRIFNSIDNLYRLAAINAMMNNDEERIAFYANKLKQYGEFADDKEPLYLYRFMEIHQLTSYTHQYEKASELISEYEEELNRSVYFRSYLLAEKGKALYGIGRYEEAIERLKQVEIADYIHHPIDLSIFYEGDAYLARSYFALGLQEEAESIAKKTMELIAPMPASPYKRYIEETYQLIVK